MSIALSLIFRRNSAGILSVCQENAAAEKRDIFDLRNRRAII